MKKIILSMAVAAMMVMAMAACGSAQSASQGSAEGAGSSAESSQAQGSASGSINGDGVANAGKLVMATSADFPPYEYHEGDKIVGIDVEIAQAIAQKMGVELEIEDIAFDSVILEVMSGKADLGLAGITATEDRKANLDFSESYTNARQLVIVQEDSPIMTVEDLEGKNLGVQSGTTGDLMASDVKDATVEHYTKGMDAVMALTQGKVDAVIIDSEVAKYFVKQTSGIKILDQEFANENYVIVVKKGNAALLNNVNAALKELKEDGTIDSIIGKYIKAE